MKVAILGFGSMGQWFAKFAKKRKWKVSIYDVDKEKGRKAAENLKLNFSSSKEEATQNADIILISVPITETPKLIKEASEFVEKDSLIIDIASVKEKAVEEMEKVQSEVELASLHPLFGPGAENLENKNIISIPVKKGRKYELLKKEFSKLGTNIVEMKAEKHDKLMAVIQSLTHFSLMTYFSAFASMEYHNEAEKFKTPIFKNLFNLTNAFLYEDPKLCADIQRENKYSEMARNSIIEKSNELDNALKNGDLEKMEKIFEKAKEEIGSEEIKQSYKRLYKNEEK